MTPPGLTSPIVMDTHRARRTRPRSGEAALGSLNDLIGPQQQRLWDREPERLGGLEVDHQLELRRLLHGQVGGLGALEDLVHVGGEASEQIGEAYPIRHQPARIGKRSITEYRREVVPGGEADD